MENNKNRFTVTKVKKKKTNWELKCQGQLCGRTIRGAVFSTDSDLNKRLHAQQMQEEIGERKIE